MILTLAKVVPLRPFPARKSVYCVPGLNGPPERVTTNCPASVAVPSMSMLPFPAGVTVIAVLALEPNVVSPAIEMVCSGAMVPSIEVVVVLIIAPLPVTVPESQTFRLEALTVPPLSKCKNPVPPGPLTFPPMDNAPPVLKTEPRPETVIVPVEPVLKPTLVNVPFVIWLPLVIASVPWPLKPTYRPPWLFHVEPASTSVTELCAAAL